jgi:hypothetical protein
MEPERAASIADIITKFIAPPVRIADLFSGAGEITTVSIDRNPTERASSDSAQTHAIALPDPRLTHILSQTAAAIFIVERAPLTLTRDALVARDTSAVHTIFEHIWSAPSIQDIFIVHAPAARDENQAIMRACMHAHTAIRGTYTSGGARGDVFQIHSGTRDLISLMPPYELDKFYTNADTAARCVRIFAEAVPDIGAGDIIIEPSAGAGAFVSPIIERWSGRGVEFIFADILPEGNPAATIARADFLCAPLDPIFARATSRRIHFLGAPPFGPRSSLAKRFVARACEMQSAAKCGAIGFILPIGFRKPTLARIFPPEYHKTRDEAIPPRSFTLGCEPCRVRGTFQVWVRDAAAAASAPSASPQ